MLYRAFQWYARRFVQRNFHAVRVARSGAPPVIDPSSPIIVYMNHPSWWDPLLGMLLAQRYWPERKHYAPIDAAMLAKYRFFARLGFFGIERDSRHGGVAFLRTATAIATTANSCIWITAQGHFTDPRVRPVTLAPGLARLIQHVQGKATVVPLALEYPFWTEREPEALVRFGPAYDVTGGDGQSLDGALQQTMDALATDAQTWLADRFDVLYTGASGTSWPYDAWRWMRAKVARKPFSRSHLESLH